MARPRNPETDEIIRLLGAKMSVQAVSERLNVTSDLVKDVYRRHYDEVVTLQRAAERREKAEELAHMMAQKTGQKARRTPVPVKEAAAKMAAPEPVKETAAKMAARGPVKEAAAKKAAPEPVKEAATKKAAPEPVKEAAAVDTPAEKQAMATSEPLQEADGSTKAQAETAAKGVECSAGSTNAHELNPAPEEADRPAGGRLRVCGYLGDCGRVYTINGRTIEIANLAPRFAKEDLRVLAHEILELVRILDRREGVSA